MRLHSGMLGISALALSLGTIFTSNAFGQLKGSYEKIHYEVNDQPIQYFAGVCKARLQKEEIDKGAQKLLAEMLEKGSSVSSCPIDRPTLSRDSDFVSIGKNELFVFGWYMPSSRKWGWIALDNPAGGAYPVHNWNSSTGKSGKIDSSKRDTFASQSWSVGKSILEVRVKSSAGWISWYSSP